jgi:hypothetical protein
MESASPHDPPLTVDFKPDDYASKKLEPGQTLWHYTRDFNGLSGIMGGHIWASSVPYLNDTEEFTYGVGVALEMLGKLLDKNVHTEELLAQLAGRLAGYRPADVFTISFSTEDDDLSQWRAYSASGAPSFSLGFHSQNLELHAAAYLFQLYEVKYERDLIKEDVRQELGEEISDINKAAQGTSSDPLAFARTHIPGLMAQITTLAPRYKHPKFAAEKEWRLIRWIPVLSSPPRLPRRFRSGGSLIVPYVAMPLHTPRSEAEVFEHGLPTASPLAAVRIGPCPHPDHLKYAVGDMAARSGLNLDVLSSEVPFRNW